MINIKNANYGRTDKNVCCNSNERVLRKRCLSDQTEIIRNTCNNLNSCKLEARADIFGDPCPFLSKYLEIQYTCDEIFYGRFFFNFLFLIENYKLNF